MNIDRRSIILQDKSLLHTCTVMYMVNINVVSAIHQSQESYIVSAELATKSAVMAETNLN